MLWLKNLSRKERCGSCCVFVRERGRPSMFSSVGNQRCAFCETRRKKRNKAWNFGWKESRPETMYLTIYSGEKHTLHAWKIRYLSAFFPSRNTLQFCSIPQIKRSNCPGNSDQATDHSPGFLVHRSSRVVIALVLLPGCSEDEDSVNEAEKNQHEEYYHQYTENESHNVPGIWVQKFSLLDYLNEAHYIWLCQ